MTETKRFENALYKMIVYSFGIIILWVWFLDMLFPDKLPFLGQHYYILPNPIMFLAFSVFFMLLIYLAKRIKCPETISKSEKILEWTVFSLFFVFQLIFSYSSYAYAAWDPAVIWKFALLINSGYEIDTSYLSLYPNNMLLLTYMVAMQKLSSMIPLQIFDDSIYILLIVNCIINSLTGIILYKLIKHFCGRKIAWMGWFVYVILVGTSGWIDIYYSDSLALLAPVSVAYIWVCGKGKIKYPAIGFISAFFAYIKPQSIIILIAIVIMEIIAVIKNNKEKILKRIIPIASIAAGALVAVLSVKAINYDRYDINPEGSVSMAHYFMMGLQNMGEYYQPDVDFSASFETKKERNAANWNEALKRINEMGISGLGKHAYIKALYNFSDGTFGFEHIGSYWFWETDRIVENKLAMLFTNIVRGGGKARLYTECVRQGAWLSLLFLAAVFPFVFRKENDENRQKLAGLVLALLGLFMFVMLFEARARYLYIYVPIYICIGIVCIDRLIDRFKRNKKCPS